MPSAGLFGSFFGVSGGVGYSKSSASQNSLRQVASSDHQKLRDRINQSANAVRSLRSTVVQTVSQGERFEVSSESVANYNHCHAITIQYFEVLRHFRIRQRFAGARECLFVPLIMSQFDLKKALRWKESLQLALLDNNLSKGFDAGNRIEHRWSESDFPSGTFASENIITASGFVMVKFDLRRPIDDIQEVDDKDRAPVYANQGAIIYHKKRVAKIIPKNWDPYRDFLEGIEPVQFYEDYLEGVKDKDAVFHRMLGEKIARSFVDKLEFHALDENGRSIRVLPIDASLASRYHRNRNLRISLRIGPTNVKREDFHYLKINVRLGSGFPASTVTVQSGLMKYRTSHYDGFLFRYQRIGDDLSGGDGVAIYTGSTAEELKDPRKEDVALTNELVAHLNDNLEYYHKAIWMNMTPERRFMLLDGIILNGKGQGRSVASLVDNQLLTIVGNSLVFPVAPGLNLNPDFGNNESLDEFYAVAAQEPISVSIPTKGVFAESVMGHCNSCEEKDESRFWRWEEAPIPDSPTAINPVSTDSRRAASLDLTPQSLPNPVVNIQNAPAAPDPTGLASTLNLLGKGDAFRDLTGFEQNQKNALASLEGTLNSATELAKLGGKLNAIKEAKANSLLSKEDAQEATKKLINAPDGETEGFTNAVSKIKKLQEMVDSGDISEALGNKGKEKILEQLINSDEKVWDNDTVKDLIKSAGESEDSSVKIDKEGNVSVEKKGTGKSAVLAQGAQQFFDYEIKIELNNSTDGYPVFKLKNKAKSEMTFDLFFYPNKTVTKVVGAGKTYFSGTEFSKYSNPVARIIDHKPEVKGYLGEEKNDKIVPATTQITLPVPKNMEFICTQSFHNSPNSTGNRTHVNGKLSQRFAVDLVRNIADGSSVPAHDLSKRSFNVCATRTGIVIQIRNNQPDLTATPSGSEKDNFVLVRHSDGTFGIYSHFKQNSISVRIGQAVKEGITKLGEAGNSGDSTGVHAHFAVLKTGKLNPNNIRELESMAFKFKGQTKDPNSQNATWQGIPNGVLEQGRLYKRS